MTHYIYTLSDETGVRYVGQTNNPKIRLTRHLCDAKRDKTPKSAWFRQLLSEGKLPVMAVIDEGGDVDAKERKWTEHYLSLGCDLLNSNYSFLPEYGFRGVGDSVFIGAGVSLPVSRNGIGELWRVLSVSRDEIEFQSGDDIIVIRRPDEE